MNECFVHALILILLLNQNTYNPHNKKISINAYIGGFQTLLHTCVMILLLLTLTLLLLVLTLIIIGIDT